MTKSTVVAHLGADVNQIGDADLADRYAPADSGSPLLRVNMVTSLDGAVEIEGRSRGLSNPIDLRLLGLLRGQCDALLVGAGTLRVEGYGPIRLAEPLRRWRRERGLPDRDPTLVVVSASLDLDPEQPAFAQAPQRPVVLTHAGAPASRRAALATATDVVTAGEREVDLSAAVALLRGRGLRQILCEGGPHLFGALTAADLVDELCLTLSPLLAGAGAGRITAGPPSPVRPMALHHVITAGDCLFLRYRRAMSSLPT